MSAAVTDAVRESMLVDALHVRWPAARPFVFAGAVCIVAGGLVAAVTRPADFEVGSWVAAYLVLVGGVAQIALGAGQAWIARVPPRPVILRAEAASWNIASALTIAGTLAEAPAVTTAGAIASVASLALFLTGTSDPRPTAHMVGLAYRVVVVVVLVSAPVGVVLAWTRHG